MDFLVLENNKLKDEILKIKKSLLPNKDREVLKKLKEKKGNQEKILKEQLLQNNKEIEILKKTILEQSEELKNHKNYVGYLQHNFISKDEVILNEMKFKSLNDELQDAHKIIENLQVKYKNSVAVNNSEKTLLNNSTIDVKNENEILKIQMRKMKEEASQAKKEYDLLCDKYNTQVSTNMRFENLIEEMKSKK